MRVSELLALACASVAIASPVDERDNRGTPSKRPDTAIAPYHPGKAFPVSPARKKVCTVRARGSGKDDSKNILKTIQKCNNGGHVVFPKEENYTIGTALDLTFLKHIDLGECRRVLIVLITPC